MKTVKVIEVIRHVTSSTNMDKESSEYGKRIHDIEYYATDGILLFKDNINY